MSFFPMCVELKDKWILLVGTGAQTAEKLDKLRPFGAVLTRVDTLRAEDLQPRPVFVVVGDHSEAEARRCSMLCGEQGIPVNVVDRPELCSFFFPALISRGELTVSVSTGGKSPGAAAWLRGRIEQALPDKMEEILEWLSDIRRQLKSEYPAAVYGPILKQMTERAFAEQRPLTQEECAGLLGELK